MASVSRSTTVTNNWFTPTPVKSGFKNHRRHRRSAKEQALHDAAKAEHTAASHAAAQGDWVVKGKRHNKIAVKEQTPDEKAEAARIQQIKDLKAIEKTISGSMSVINKKRTARSQGGNPKKPRILLEEKEEKKEKKEKKEKSIVTVTNSFALLAVDSTDDEAEAEIFEVKPLEFPTLGTTSRKVETPSKISYSFALQSKPTKKQIGPEDFPSPPKTRVCWADQLDDEETSDEEEEDDLPIRPGQSWADLI